LHNRRVIFGKHATGTQRTQRVIQIASREDGCLTKETIMTHEHLTEASDTRVTPAEAKWAVEDLVITTRKAWAPGADDFLSLGAVIGVGFGFAALTRDGKVVYEERDETPEQVMTVADAERLAQESEDRDWRIHLVATLDDRHYKRIGTGKWQLYKRGYGLS
jgi:hypothetical protein